MIVNKTNQGWQIIFQRHHALLAARIGRHMSFLLPAPPLDVEMIIAIAEHDDGQRDWHDGRFVNDKGAPVDFSEYEYDLKHAINAVKEASYKSLYIHLLVSRHITELYGKARNTSAELQEYLSDQAHKQKDLRAHFSISKQEFDRHYQVLRWCDELSLAICRNQSACELPRLIQKESSCILSNKDEYKIHPWPFPLDELSFPVETYELSQNKFTGNEDLFRHLHRTSPTRRHVVLLPA